MRKGIQKILIILGVMVICLINSFSATALEFDFDVISESVFIVISGDVDGYNVSLGSGFAIDNNHIVTNAHVITDESNIAIGCYSETAENNIGDVHIVDLVFIDEDIDIAVLKVNGPVLTPLKTADVDTIKVGDDVYAIGAPEGLAYTLTKGAVSSKLRRIAGVDYVQTDTAINHGNSGGPLLNSNGEVIGVNTLKLSTGENIGLAIRMDFVMSHIEQSGVIVSVGNTISSNQSVNENSDYNNTTSSYQKDNKNTYETYNDDAIRWLVYTIISVIGLISSIVIIVVKHTVLKKPKKEAFDVPSIANKSVSEDGKHISDAQKTNFLDEQPRKAGICILTGNMKDVTVNMKDGQTLVIGKDGRFANLVLDSSYSMVSRMHCSVTYNTSLQKYFVVDNSSNGTYFENGTRLTKNTRTPIAKGSVLKLADDCCIIKLV